jgi:NTE family protein
MTSEGVVLGAGGVLGAAWTIGALAALEQEYGCDPREAEVLIGTSAGSVLAGALGCGVGVATLLNHQKGIVVEGDPRLDYDHRQPTPAGRCPRCPARASARPRRARSALRPWRSRPMGALAARCRRAAARSRRSAARRRVCPPAPGPAHPRPGWWRWTTTPAGAIPFGSDGAPHASLRSAVMASCAIPGWYAPVVIGGRRYVDGGACSPTSVDLVRGSGLDEVVVLSPMTSLSYDRPTTVAGRLERRVRRLSTRAGRRRDQEGRRDGHQGDLPRPDRRGPHAIGSNLMDPRRRTRCSRPRCAPPPPPCAPAAGRWRRPADTLCVRPSAKPEQGRRTQGAGRRGR